MRWEQPLNEGGIPAYRKSEAASGEVDPAIETSSGGVDFHEVHQLLALKEAGPLVVTLAFRHD
jgi:hypothetical protein